VTKQGNKALNASLLLFLRSVKRFIASLLQFFTQHHTLHHHCFLEGNHCLALHRHYFFKASLDASSPLLFKVTLRTSGGEEHWLRAEHTGGEGGILGTF
jgi:hypothetical protein